MSDDLTSRIPDIARKHRDWMLDQTGCPEHPDLDRHRHCLTCGEPVLGVIGIVEHTCPSEQGSLCG